MQKKILNVEYTERKMLILLCLCRADIFNQLKDWLSYLTRLSMQKFIKGFELLAQHIEDEKHKKVQGIVQRAGPRGKEAPIQIKEVQAGAIS